MDEAKNVWRQIQIMYTNKYRPKSSCVHFQDNHAWIIVLADTVVSSINNSNDINSLILRWGELDRGSANCDAFRI